MKKMNKCNLISSLKMLSRVCQEYLNNLNEFIMKPASTGLAKMLREKVASLRNNSVSFWLDIEDYVKPGFLSDKNDREELDEMIMIFNHYKKDLIKFIGPIDKRFDTGGMTDWINWYCSLPSEKIKLVDEWFESKL